VYLPTTHGIAHGDLSAGRGGVSCTTTIIIIIINIVAVV